MKMEQNKMTLRDFYLMEDRLVYENSRDESIQRLYCSDEDILTRQDGHMDKGQKFWIKEDLDRQITYMVQDYFGTVAAVEGKGYIQAHSACFAFYATPEELRQIDTDSQYLTKFVEKERYLLQKVAGTLPPPVTHLPKEPTQN